MRFVFAFDDEHEHTDAVRLFADPVTGQDASTTRARVWRSDSTISVGRILLSLSALLFFRGNTLAYESHYQAMERSRPVAVGYWEAG